MIAVGPEHTGSVRFVNCAFWGPTNQIAQIHGKGTVGFSDCTFVQWGGSGCDRYALQVGSGTVLVNGCEFRQSRPHISLGLAVERAVITGNVFRGQPQIDSQSNGNVVVGLNSHD